MTKKKNSIVTFVVVLVILAVLVIFAYGKFMTRQQKNPDEQVPRTEVEKLIAKDIEVGYPETPVEVMKLWGRIDQCLYNNELEEAQFNALGAQLRLFYSKELLEQNKEQEHMNRLHSEVETFQKNKSKIVSYSAETGKPVTYKDINGRECAKVRVSFFLNSGGGYVKQYQEYILIKEDGKWKVQGFRKSAGDETVTKEEALENK